jgi:hypothetical protein
MEGKRSGNADSECSRRRDAKAKDKFETKESLDFDDLSKQNEGEMVHGLRNGPEWNENSVNVVSSDAAREGSFERDEPEKIMGVVKQISNKEWLMKIKWKKDLKTGKRPKNSIYTNTTLKKICPDLLFDFYESNVISNV